RIARSIIEAIAPHGNKQMAQYNAIPTTYKSVNFRSRLEAKWAAMFDLLKWEWHYEPIDLNGWIPDFLLTKTSFENSKPCLVECKPIVTGKLPRVIEIKIERALGVPFKLMPEGHEAVGNKADDNFDWHTFFDNTPYQALVVGAVVPCHQFNNGKNVGL